MFPRTNRNFPGKLSRKERWETSRDNAYSRGSGHCPQQAAVTSHASCRFGGAWGTHTSDQLATNPGGLPDSLGLGDLREWLTELTVLNSLHIKAISWEWPNEQTHGAGSVRVSNTELPVLSWWNQGTSVFMWSPTRMSPPWKPRQRPDQFSTVENGVEGGVISPTHFCTSPSCRPNPSRGASYGLWAETQEQERPD